MSGLDPAYLGRLVAAGMVVSATAVHKASRRLELPGHPFYVATLFQPQVGSSQSETLHPLIAALARTVIAGGHLNAPLAPAVETQKSRSSAAGWLGSLVPGPFGNIDQRILGRSIAAEIALHNREAGEVTLENAAMKKLAAHFNSVGKLAGAEQHLNWPIKQW